jgi:hypothetical protein
MHETTCYTYWEPDLYYLHALSNPNEHKVFVHTYPNWPWWFHISRSREQISQNVSDKSYRLSKQNRKYGGIYTPAFDAGMDSLRVRGPVNRQQCSPWTGQTEHWALSVAARSAAPATLLFLSHTYLGGTAAIMKAACLNLNLFFNDQLKAGQSMKRCAMW